MSSKEVYNVVRLVPKPGKFKEVADSFAVLSKYVHENEPKTQVYFALQPEGTEEFVFVEKYADEEAVKEHAASNAFKKFARSLAGALAEAPEIKKSAFVNGFEGREKL
ncbi:hypothetical protein BJX70DRAFT_394931 [Aspergillus crustosus]